MNAKIFETGPNKKNTVGLKVSIEGFLYPSEAVSALFMQTAAATIWGIFYNA